MRGYHHWRWHLDEMYVRINGELHYLWRAVDHEGEVLESYVAKKRDKFAGLRFMKKALKRHGKPERIVTDGLRSYPAAMWGATVPIGPRIRTCLSGDGNGRCSGSDG